MATYVYIAGRLSGDPPSYLANVHNFCATARELMERGYCPINPAADLLEGIMSSEPLTTALYQQRSLDLLGLLAGRDAWLLVIAAHHPDGRRSMGTAREIEEAGTLGIPVVYTLADLPAVSSDQRHGGPND
jgi:hypothetical protein